MHGVRAWSVVFGLNTGLFAPPCTHLLLTVLRGCSFVLKGVLVDLRHRSPLAVVDVKMRARERNE